MIGIPIGLFLFNAGEWAAHKYILHGLGKKGKRSYFRYHFHEHHKEARKHDMYDRFYHRSIFGDHAQGREALALLVAGVAHAPLFPIAPFYTATIWYSLIKYHRVHKRAHMDPDWAREHLPWHYDHHMGVDQDKNWGVTHDWFDRIMKTREPYVGTPHEREARRKRAESVTIPASAARAR